MRTLRQVTSRWGASILLMIAIFAVSAQPASRLPSFGWGDLLVKKGGHVLGFGLLGLAYWRGFHWEPRRVAVAWLMALGYAVTDELHQAFVPGRHPSPVDVLLFDGGGAALALLLKHIGSAKRPKM
jgi:VanZ family protein